MRGNFYLDTRKTFVTSFVISWRNGSIHVLLALIRTPNALHTIIVRASRLRYVWQRQKTVFTSDEDVPKAGLCTSTLFTFIRDV